MVIVITGEMIERAAMASRDAAGNKSGKGKPWSKLPDTIKSMYRREAEICLRAGLAAIE